MKETTIYLLIILVAVFYTRFIYTEMQYRYKRKRERLTKQAGAPRYKTIHNNKKQNGYASKYSNEKR